MTNIKFGTDGWRAIIAKDFTTDNVARVAKATADYVKKNFEEPSICIGHDCRFAGDLFTETAVAVFLQEGIKVFQAKGFVTTPMVSLGTVELNCSVGVVMTASHNPPSYNGYKLKSAFGGPMLPDGIAEVESYIPDSYQLKNYNKEDALSSNQLELVDLEGIYLQKIEEHFDLDSIQNSGIRFAYDAMYGAGQNVVKKILPNATFLHCEDNPGFMGQAPEPIAKNLTEFSELIQQKGNIDIGLATDGDADRIGLFNSKGEFIDSHRILLLLIHYLYKYKNQSGKVVTAFSTSTRIAKLCKEYGLEHIITKIGFKHIAGYMVEDDVLVGGEESGGIAIKGFIPERDGIWMGLTILEFMARTGKSLDELLAEVYDIVGEFAYDRNDLPLAEELKQSIIEQCSNGEFKQFGNLKVQQVKTIDGFKFFFDDYETVLIRPSGTEPLLRVYAEADTMEKVQSNLKQVKDTILP